MIRDRTSVKVSLRLMGEEYNVQEITDFLNITPLFHVLEGVRSEEHTSELQSQR